MKETSADGTLPYPYPSPYDELTDEELVDWFLSCCEEVNMGPLFDVFAKIHHPLLQRSDVTEDVIRRLLTPLLDNEGTDHYDKLINDGPVGITIMAGLAHPNCPADILARACMTGSMQFNSAAPHNPNCPDEAAVQWALRRG